MLPSHIKFFDIFPSFQDIYTHIYNYVSTLLYYNNNLQRITLKIISCPTDQKWWLLFAFADLKSIKIKLRLLQPQMVKWPRALAFLTCASNPLWFHTILERGKKGLRKLSLCPIKKKVRQTLEVPNSCGFFASYTFPFIYLNCNCWSQLHRRLSPPSNTLLLVFIYKASSFKDPLPCFICLQV